MTATIYCGDARETLATLPDGSVQTCITSPPYYGLRDYGVDGQIGLEPTVEAFVENLVDVFREVRRVLADDGTLWLNLGDSYVAPRGNTSEKPGYDNKAAGKGADLHFQGTRPHGGLKTKDLIGVPWMVAFALRADGWYLRQDIIWSKPNPMPESVRDRCTKAHEYLFLLSKSPRYYYDAAAIAEDALNAGQPMKTADGWDTGEGGHGAYHREGREKGQYLGAVQMATRNKRSVWTVSTQGFPEAHFATFPPKLIEPCILAGSLPLGAYEPDDLILTPTGEGDREDDPSLMTGRAGMNRPRRAVESVRPMSRAEQAAYAEQLKFSPHRAAMEEQVGVTTFAHYVRTDRSGARPVSPALLDAWIAKGWVEPVNIPPRQADPARSTVLDPFAGSGTTGLVANRHNRNFIGIELNPEYAEMARRRITNDAPMFNRVEVLA